MLQLYATSYLIGWALSHMAWQHVEMDQSSLSAPDPLQPMSTIIPDTCMLKIPCRLPAMTRLCCNKSVGLCWVTSKWCNQWVEWCSLTFTTSHTPVGGFTVSQSPCTALTAGNLPAVRAVQGDCQWHLTMVGISTITWSHNVLQLTQNALDL